MFIGDENVLRKGENVHITWAAFGSSISIYTKEVPIFSPFESELLGAQPCCLSSVFPKKAWITWVQSRPRSDLDGLVRVWPNASGLEASWCAGVIRPGF